MPLVSLADINNPEAEALVQQASRLSKMYDEYVGSDSGDGHERKPGIHASEVSGCERRIVYNLLAYEKRSTNTKVWRQRFNIGHAIHHMVQTDFYGMAKKSNGQLLFQAERDIVISPDLQAVAAKWHIHSSTDGVFTFLDDDGVPELKVGVEIKSASPTEYEKLKAPMDYHLDQVHVYMACLDVPLFWLFYWNKGNQNNTNSEGPFLVKWDQARWDRLEKKFQRCHDAAYADTLPEREESGVCSFCQYAYTCRPPKLVQFGRSSQKVWHPRK